MRPYTSYRGDPYWTRARFVSRCHKCGTTIHKGDDIFYYPRSKSAYCDGECGKIASADFESCAADEYAYSH